MINDVAKEIIDAFKTDMFVETGFFRGSTTTVIRSWFKDLSILEIEINPLYCNYGKHIFRNDPNTEIVLSDSKIFLENNISKFFRSNNPMFYLDAHWDPKNWPLRNEIMSICKLNSPIIIIDDFKTPDETGGISKIHGYDSYLGVDCDKDYILDLIKPHTDCILYAKKPTIDGQGCGIIFINKYYDEIKSNLNLNNFIVEKI
tara:strand:+ start:4915 stop:5520 length:606 start_codon:yes stop_codon:yes gene_type:complete